MVPALPRSSRLPPDFLTLSTYSAGMSFTVCPRAARARARKWEPGQASMPTKMKLKKFITTQPQFPR